MTRKEFQQALKALGMTIPQFAEHTGLAASTLYHWGQPDRPIPQWAGMLIAAWSENQQLKRPS